MSCSMINYRPRNKQAYKRMINIDFADFDSVTIDLVTIDFVTIISLHFRCETAFAAT